MGRAPGWAATAAGRPAMRSPGRPPAGTRGEKVPFWRLIVQGVTSEEAGRLAGVSPAVGSRWFREGGGMPTVTLVAPSGRYLSFAEREDIAVLRAQKIGVREIARCLQRSPSTISRELRRNAATRGGRLDYLASTAQWHADRRGRRPKAAILAGNERLHQYVQDRLAGAITTSDGTPVHGPQVPVEGAASGPSARPPVGEGVEPGADRQPPAGRLPG